MRSSVKAGLVALMVGAIVAAPASASAQTIGGIDLGAPLGLGQSLGQSVGLAARGGNLEVVGLVDGTDLVTFRTRTPQLSTAPRAVTGLAGDTSLVGIDYRVQNGLLYGVGDAGGLYTIDGNAAATEIGRLTIALEGTHFGVDFNPAANALRITSDTGQNLRQPFAATPLADTIADTPLTNGGVAATDVTGAAYTNNDLDASTATTLFDISTATDQVLIQSPANSGQLAATGNLGVDAGSNAGFDIYSIVRNGKTVSNSAFATLQVDGRYALHQIDVLTGAATRIGALRGAVSDIAIPLNQF